MLNRNQTQDSNLDLSFATFGRKVWSSLKLHEKYLQ